MADGAKTTKIRPLAQVPRADPHASSDLAVASFMAAWHSANPLNHGVPAVTYENGWFVFRYNGNFSGRYRLSDLMQMTGRLIERAGGEVISGW